jgi:hypothetical protein
MPVQEAPIQKFIPVVLPSSDRLTTTVAPADQEPCNDDCGVVKSHADPFHRASAIVLVSPSMAMAKSDPVEPVAGFWSVSRKIPTKVPWMSTGKFGVSIRMPIVPASSFANVTPWISGARPPSLSPAGSLQLCEFVFGEGVAGASGRARFADVIAAWTAPSALGLEEPA